ncbi:MAG: aspartate carbamoyltransferase regulatory subunit [Muribaculaceae bacterium]|nr:aspartate carbamoyltransferase regulatory subunit [Muribaculaceae bacterium]
MMGESKKELAVAALENGTVIDHIPPSALFKVVNILGITKLDNGITIGNNLDSRRYGKKGIIKVADLFFPEDTLNRIALIAPNAKINVIRDFKIVNKHTVSLPDDIIDIVKCNNPKCITNNEPMKTHFEVIDKENVTIKCHYCERTTNKDDIVIK